MSDLIERLCEVQGRTTKSYRNPDGPEAANEIERLQLELKYKLDQSERIKNLEAEIERLTDELINVEELAKDRYCKMQSEIERLNAEVTHYAQAYHREMVANKKLQAENERLTALRKEDRNDMQRLSDQLDYLSDQNAKLQAVVDALKQIEVRGLEIINEHVGGSDASYVAQELTSMALAALEETDDA